MKRTRATLVVILIAAATAASASASKPTRKADATAKPVRPAKVNAAEWNAASLFADSYVRYLDGNGSAARLPHASARVLKQAKQVGRIPAAARRGPLRLVSLRPAHGGLSNSFFVTAKDRAHTFRAQEQLAKSHGSWSVVRLLPPDFDQSLAPAPPKPAPQPAGSTAARKAAVTFLSGYLPWLYGQASITKAKDGAPALIAKLKANPPNVPPAMTTLHPTANAVGILKHGTGWLALADVTDGESTYQLRLKVFNRKVGKHGHQWLVTAVSAS